MDLTITSPSLSLPTPSLFTTFFLFLWLCQVLLATKELWSSLWHAGSFGSDMQTLSCCLWDLAPWSRSPALGAQSLSHWTTREVPSPPFFSAFHVSAHGTPIQTAAPGKTVRSSSGRPLWETLFPSLSHVERLFDTDPWAPVLVVYKLHLISVVTSRCWAELFYWWVLA